MDSLKTSYSKCPLCDNENINLIKIGDCSNHPMYNPVLSPQIKWLQCQNCDHVFTEGYFTEEGCSVVFSKTNENQKPGYDFENQRHIWARIVKLVSQFVDHGNWLDVGFGNGSLLFTADEWGFAPVGLDLRADSVAIMNNLGFKAFCQSLDDFNPSEKMSVISMADVLEHTPYPKEVLRSAHRLLVDNGVLFLSMPNYNCAVWRFLDMNNANPYWGELEHYHNFSRKRLFELLQEVGFEPVQYGVSERYRACMEIVARKKNTIAIL